MKYEERVVAFIDILGFRKIIEDTIDKDGKDIQDKVERLNKILLLTRDVLDMDKSGVISSKSKIVTQFSDSIVISFLFSEESEVFYTLLEILHLIMNLLNHGIVCRGGIAHGKLIHNDKILFGPAFILAYMTELKAALFPRVVLDQSIIDIGAKYHAWHHKSEHEKDSILEIVSKDTDDMFYIDYFGSALSELDDLDYEAPDYIENLRKIIKSNLKISEPDLRVKYGWMRNKFNKLVRELKDAECIQNLREVGEIELVDYYESLKEIL